MKMLVGMGLIILWVAIALDARHLAFEARVGTRAAVRASNDGSNE
jgi:hypothetical protein